MSSISAGTTSGTALVSTGDTTGTLDLKTGASATTALSIDASQNVGIGTSSPSTKLAVVGTASAIYSSATGSGSYGVYGSHTRGQYGMLGYYDGTNDWGIYTNSHAYIAGNVGIGTSSPSSTLQLKASSGNTGLYIQDASGSPNLSFLDSAGTVQWQLYSTMGGAAGLDPLILYNSSVGSVATFSTSGNLGLGVTPSAWQTTAGSTALQFLGSAIYGYRDTGQYLCQNTYYDGSAWKYYASGVAACRLDIEGGLYRFNIAPSGTAGNAASFTSAMTLDSIGRLLVGVTSTSGSSRLVVNNSNDVSGDFNIIGTLGANCNNTSSYHIICATGGSDRFYVYGNGNVQNTNNSYGAISDIKLKENIADATPKLNDLMQVRVVNYNLIGGTQKQLGVIAQELEQVFPGMVDESLDRDAEGNDLGTTTKSVKYSVFVPMLIKAMQEQQTIIESLTARIAALESK